MKEILVQLHLIRTGMDTLRLCRALFILVITFSTVSMVGLSFAFALALSLPSGKVSLKEIPGKPTTSVLKITGSIAHPMALETKDLLREMNPAHTGLLIHLNSGGGSVQEGLKIIAQIRLLKERGIKVSTTVQNGEICGSMCVPVYVQGENRYAGAVSAFMFHGVVRHGLTNIPDDSRTRQHLNIFLDAGVAEAWIDRMWQQGAFTTPGAYWMTAQQLMDQNSGIITRLLPAHSVEDPWSAPVDPQIRPR